MKGALLALPGIAVDAVVTAVVRLCAGLVLGWRRLGRWWRDSMGPRVTLAVVIALVLSVLSILLVDRPVADWLRGSDADLKAAARLVTQLGDSAGYIVGGIVVAVLLWWLERANPSFGARWRLGLWSRRSAYFAASVIVSGLLSLLLKSLFGRPRPRMWFREEMTAFQPFTIDSSSDFASYPSGHATTIWAVAFALAFIFGRRAWIVMPIALAVSLSRVVLSSHYVGDVIAGAVLGGVTALALAPLFRIETGRVSGPATPAEREMR